MRPHTMTTHEGRNISSRRTSPEFLGTTTGNQHQDATDRTRRETASVHRAFRGRNPDAHADSAGTVSGRDRTRRPHTRIVVGLVAAACLTVPAKADAKGKRKQGCKTRECHARVNHRACDQSHPRSCVLHVIYHQRIHGWRRSWLLRIPGCESSWNPGARNPSGASGLYQFMPSTWASTPYGNRSIWSPRWQPYGAAWMLRAGRSNEWVCR